MFRAYLVSYVLLTACVGWCDTRFEARIVDEDTGQATAARIYIRGSSGAFYHVQSADSEQGSAVPYKKDRRDIGSVEVHTTVSAHPFYADLPPGKYEVTVVRGKEYHPIRRSITVADRTVKEVFRLKRWVHMAKRNWFSGDTHVHRPLNELPNILLAEDLNVALPLTQWVTRSHTPPTQGQKNLKLPKPEVVKVSPHHLIYPINTEYEIFSVGAKRHTLGAVFVLGHQRPLTLGVPPVRPVAAEARRQGALLDLDKHSWPWSMMIVPIMDVDLYELSNNHVWRTDFGFPNWTVEAKADYMNVETNAKGGWTEWGWIDFGFQNYYALLNCGFRMRPTAGTASGVHPVPLGFGRVYVEVPGDFSFEKWMKNLDAGRSFVSTGPMLFVKANGKPAGSKLLTREHPRCELKVEAEHRVPLDRIEVIVNGEVVKTIKPSNQRTKAGSYRSVHSYTRDSSSSCWVAVRCFEKNDAGRVRFAHSSPMYFDNPQSPVRPRKNELNYLISLMERELKRNADTLDDKALSEYREALKTYQSMKTRD